MAIHKNITSLLKESLEETILSAENCFRYRKDDGGCLGYPTIILLFSIVDSIGSYYYGNNEFTINIDGKEEKIKKTTNYFYILNSHYYNQSLSKKQIKIIYDNYRSLLNHNLAMPPDHFLGIGDKDEGIFIINDEKPPLINLYPFLEKSKTAVKGFIKDIDSVVSKSKQHKNILQKSFHK